MGSPKNILILMTDQQRTSMYWPEGWAAQNLPCLTGLMDTGLTFTQAITNTCQCSPSRATLWTSLYPSQHGVTTTSGTLPSNLANLATVLSSAGYQVVYKGKWHLDNAFLSHEESPTSKTASADDSALQSKYGFTAWNSPDAGTTLTKAKYSLGGGNPNNDARFINGESLGTDVQNAIEFLQSYDASNAAPFCLIVSLVNPHDISIFPKMYVQAGYKLSKFQNLQIELPPTYTENLAHNDKPSVQAGFLDQLDLYLGKLSQTDAESYVRFYAYLHTLTDTLLGQVVSALEVANLQDETLIVRLSDHGELGMSHGGLRQKDYTAYEEMIRVPLIFSIPKMYPSAQTTDALAGLIDVLPTLASVAGVPNMGQYGFAGKDLSPILEDPSQSVQDAVLFTFDDRLFDPGQPAHIVCIREANWKLAMYYDPAGDVPRQFEMYDLENDPTELTNLWKNGDFAQVRSRLAGKLDAEAGAVRGGAEPLPSAASCA